MIQVIMYKSLNNSNNQKHKTKQCTSWQGGQIQIHNLKKNVSQLNYKNMRFENSARGKMEDWVFFVFVFVLFCFFHFHFVQFCLCLTCHGMYVSHHAN